MVETIENTPIENFVMEQVPGIQICYHDVKGELVPDWVLTLKVFLNCHRDYSSVLKQLLPDDFKRINTAINKVIADYTKNGEMKGPDDFVPLRLNRRLLYNRISYKLYLAYQDGVDMSKGLKKLIQAYSSDYCMMLNAAEERAICVLYHAAIDGRDPNKENLSAEDIMDVAYTFFCLRIRKALSRYEKALNAYNLLNDGISASIMGFYKAIKDYDFTTPVTTGMGPGRLNIPIITELKIVLRDASGFSISEATWKKILAYNEDEDRNLNRKELMQKYHAAPATVDMMLTYGRTGMLSLENGLEEDKDSPFSIDEALGYDEDGYFMAEIKEDIHRLLDDDELEVFEEVVIQGKQYKEVAQDLGYPERKVKYLFEHCKDKIQPFYGLDKKGRRAKK